jgi:hypothetical protein
MTVHAERKKIDLTAYMLMRTTLHMASAVEFGVPWDSEKRDTDWHINGYTK